MIGILGRERLLNKCSEIFEEMSSQDVGWNVYSFTALINAYGRNGQYETSLHLLARMKRERIAPTLLTYNTVKKKCLC
jgi:pentatricopeptide repeat protein